MKLGIINSAFQQAGMGTKAGLEHIARIGFDTVDIFTEALNISEKEVQLIENTCSTQNLPIASLPVVSLNFPAEHCVQDPAGPVVPGKQI